MGQRGFAQVRRLLLVRFGISLIAARHPLLFILNSTSHAFSFYIDLDLDLTLTPASPPC
jgi:hypothetical protein